MFLAIGNKSSHSTPPKNGFKKLFEDIRCCSVKSKYTWVKQHNLPPLAAPTIQSFAFLISPPLCNSNVLLSSKMEARGE